MKSLDAILKSQEADKYEPSSHCKTLIMRAKKKYINGIFSWDDEFYKSNSFWFSIILIFELIGLFIIALTSLESGPIFLGIKVLALLIFAIFDYLVAREIRKEDDLLNLHKAKYSYYEKFFEIYNKNPDENKKAKEIQEKSLIEIHRIKKYSKLLFALLFIFGIIKCILFFIDYFYTGNLSIVLLDYPWLFGIYCIIYLIIPLLHYFFYSHLYWINIAYTEVDKECAKHYLERSKAIDRTDKNIDVSNCKRKRPFSFDVHNLKTEFSACNSFVQFNEEPIGYSGIMTDANAEDIISTKGVEIHAQNTRVPIEIFRKFLNVQVLKFKIDVAENTPVSGVGHYDHSIRSVAVSESNL